MSQSEVPVRPFTILLADDDEEDRELARDALQDARLANEMKFVVDGQDLLDYLRHEGRFTEETWTQYWFEIVELPNGETSGHARLTGLTDWAPAPGVESRH
jgi:CheY-like chemotaxis protein